MFLREFFIFVMKEIQTNCFKFKFQCQRYFAKIRDRIWKICPDRSKTKYREKYLNSNCYIVYRTKLCPHRLIQCTKGANWYTKFHRELSITKHKLQSSVMVSNYKFTVIVKFALLDIARSSRGSYMYVPIYEPYTKLVMPLVKNVRFDCNRNLWLLSNENVCDADAW